MDVHNLLRNVASTVICTAIEGEGTTKWIRANFGKDSKRLVDQVKELLPSTTLR